MRMREWMWAATILALVAVCCRLLPSAPDRTGLVAAGPASTTPSASPARAVDASVTIDGFALGITREEAMKKRTQLGLKPMKVINDDKQRTALSAGSLVGPANMFIFDERSRLAVIRGSAVRVRGTELRDGASLEVASRLLGTGSYLPKMGCGNNLDIIQWHTNGVYVQATVLQKRVFMLSISVKPQKYSTI